MKARDWKNYLTDFWDTKTNKEVVSKQNYLTYEKKKLQNKILFFCN